jgi:6-pyruvoyl-tetrahydropterin synthase
MTKAPTIKTDNFILKAVDLLNDKQDIIKNINHKEIIDKLTLDYPYTEKHWEGFVKWHKAMWNGENLSVNWMIYINEECIGSIAITRSNK